MKSTILNRALEGKFVLIAEIGVNYYDIAEKESLSLIKAAKLMIKEAKYAGVHAVKFQTYKAGGLAVRNSPPYWDTIEEPTTSQYQLFSKYDSFGYKEYKILAEYCKSLEIEFFSTPFDVEVADYLNELMAIYKISSSDLNNLPFIEHMAKKGKPILLSVGASKKEEIDRAIATIRKFNNQPAVVMHCILEYPTPFEHANLNRIKSLKKAYPDLVIGYSDHTKPDPNMDVLKTAYLLGAIVIEKHYTLDKTLNGNDHYHAMDPDDAKKIIESVNFINRIKGSSKINYIESELISRQNSRRSLVAKEEIKKGEVFTREKLTYKRPGIGIPPSDIENIVGKKSLVDIKKDSILKYSMIVKV